ncbi:acetolactate synthase small subunit [Paenibacillus methanolicus]|uniref:Acetolactate synthase small subunit n=1 Tax=Paenibacillus methanolicus TaxID=582686 RepID=A0A5S5CB65_9BACL|nr:acetolactate synthase small subunit [Paenibacillus methanolicus]TYP75590.1 acetolactate synthase small subunit [Paenibacillus methanolicus]
MSAAPLSAAKPRNRQDAEESTLFSLLAADSPGVLQRVCALLSRRGINIDSIAVGGSERSGFSRITLQTARDVHAAPTQIAHQLDKLIDVLDIANLPPQAAIQREIALIRLEACEAAISRVQQLSAGGRCELVSASSAALLLQMSGEPRRIDELLRELAPHVRQVTRSGMIAALPEQ